jgi:hypothetical protein
MTQKYMTQTTLTYTFHYWGAFVQELMSRWAFVLDPVMTYVDYL